MPVLFSLLVAGNSYENISRVGFINNFGSETGILGDPGAVSGGGEKSKRVRKNSGEKSQEGEEEPLGTRF